jgi:hypothetical protein
MNHPKATRQDKAKTNMENEGQQKAKLQS